MAGKETVLNQKSILHGKGWRFFLLRLLGYGFDLLVYVVKAPKLIASHNAIKYLSAPLRSSFRSTSRDSH
jgi:hypothetical protein